jgi:hypothetical protein
MMKHYCTPVPARRISTNGRLELRIVSKEAVRVQILAVKDNQIMQDCGTYDLLPNSTLNKVYPSLHGLTGQIVLHIHFQNAQGETLEVMQQPYEIVVSPVHSTRLLDGCWISILHWSDDEARLFNNGLRKMTDDDWKQHIYSMHKLGITSVLIQNVFESMKYVHQHDMTADTYDGKAYYPSKLYPERVPLNCSDPVEAILTAADECGMAVFMGVGLYAWFDFSPESLEWHKRVTVELNELYGHHPSLYGWYISEEIMGALYYGYNPVPDEKYKDIQVFFKEYKAFVHELTPTKPVALAPNNIRMHCYEDEWGPIMENVDILIPFAFARSENNIKEIAAMCAKRGTHFWADMEIFDFPFDDGLKPKSFPDLIKEIEMYDSLEQIYGYQYTGLLNEPGFRMELGGEDTEELYLKYKEYLKDIRSRV